MVRIPVQVHRVQHAVHELRVDVFQLVERAFRRLSAGHLRPNRTHDASNVMRHEGNVRDSHHRRSIEDNPIEVNL